MRVDIDGSVLERLFRIGRKSAHYFPIWSGAAQDFEPGRKDCSDIVSSKILERLEHLKLTLGFGC